LFRAADRGFVATRPPIPFKDGADEPADSSAAAEVRAEGQTFLIEYEAADGSVSLRGFTLQTVRISDGGDRRLCGWCHLRRAYREFRIDRILACGSMDDGVLVDPEAFITEVVGRLIVDGEVVSLDDGALRHARAKTAPDAMLLAALSRADGYMHRSERICVELYIERLVKPLDLGSVELKALHARHAKIRPTSEQINGALERLRALGPDRVTGFLRCAKDVVEADGKLHQDEVRLINDLSVELVGLRMFG
jgi:uncharacterized tellurite resistance protein B-like protein